MSNEVLQLELSEMDLKKIREALKGDPEASGRLQIAIDHAMLAKKEKRNKQLNRPWEIRDSNGSHHDDLPCSSEYKFQIDGDSGHNLALVWDRPVALLMSSACRLAIQLESMIEIVEPLALDVGDVQSRVINAKALLANCGWTKEPTKDNL